MTRKLSEKVSIKTMKDQFNNTTHTKEGTDWQKLKKIKTDCDLRLWKTVTDAEQFSKLIYFVSFNHITPMQKT